MIEVSAIDERQQPPFRMMFFGKDKKATKKEPEEETNSLEDDQPSLESSSSSSSSSSKCVAFHDFVMVREFSMNRPLSPQEEEALYYNKLDFAYFHKSSRLLARQVRFAQKNGFPYPDDELRGLEDQLTLRAMVDHKTRRVNSIRDVLQEQVQQRRMGYHDPLLLREASLKTSKESQRVSLNLAREDYKFSCTVRKEMRVGKKVVASPQHTAAAAVTEIPRRTLTPVPSSPRSTSSKRRANEFATIQHPARSLAASGENARKLSSRKTPSNYMRGAF